MHIAVPEETWVLSFSQVYPGFPQERQKILSLNSDLDEAARRLFEVLRELDAADGSVIIAEEFPDADLGLAINDRLRRAAADRDHGF